MCEPPVHGRTEASSGLVTAMLAVVSDAVVLVGRTGLPIVVSDAARTLYEAATSAPWSDNAGRLWFAALISPALPCALAGRSVRDLRVRPSDGGSGVFVVRAEPVRAATGAPSALVVAVSRATS